MRLMGHITLNFNSNKSMAAVSLDFGKAFNTTWNLCLLYKLSELKFLIRVIKVISSFLSQRNFKVSVKSEIYTPRDLRSAKSHGIGT
jgi:hypothetical protein